MAKKFKILDDRVEVVGEGSEIWMAHFEVVQMFDVFDQTIRNNVRAIFKARILWKDDVTKIQYYSNGRTSTLYNAELIIALAFRISSRNTEIFRRWFIRKNLSQTIKTWIVLCVKDFRSIKTDKYLS